MNAQERALAKAKEKVEEILWESPEGVSISALTGTLRISKPLAISALAAIGAVEQNGVWVLPDDEVVEPEQVAPGAKADTAEIELLRNPYELPTPTENPVDPCPMPCIDQPYVYQNPIADQFYQESKSDYAKVLDVMLTKVLNAVKDNGGATIGRICELVDVYPDDVPDCVDILVDNGQLISRPLYFTTVYEVAA